VVEGLLVFHDCVFEAVQFGKRLLAILLDSGALRRVVAVDEIGIERIDLGLERAAEVLIAIERGLELLHTLRPVLLILDRLFGALGLVGVLRRILAGLAWIRTRRVRTCRG